jgi:hypothetical protein
VVETRAGGWATEAGTEAGGVFARDPCPDGWEALGREVDGLPEEISPPSSQPASKTIMTRGRISKSFLIMVRAFHIRAAPKGKAQYLLSSQKLFGQLFFPDPGESFCF